MGGTESGSYTSTYPLLPGAVSDNKTFSNLAVPTGIGSYGSGSVSASAANLFSSNNWWYHPYNTTTTLFANGTIAADLSGQLVAYYKVSWSGYGSATPTTPMPDHINLLLRTDVQAWGTESYALAGPHTGHLVASATATDGAPFNESASYSQTDGGASTGTNFVTGYHLVRAAVDPMTGIATVYLNGQTHMQLDNNVPYGTVSYSPSDPNYGFGTVTNGQAYGAAYGLVAGGVRQDNREVIITSSDIETSYFRGKVDATHLTDQWPNLRNTDGSISTDSAVSPPLTQPGAPTANWSASPGLIGQANGFTSPVFSWSLAGPGTLSAVGNTSHTQLSVQFPLSATDTALNKQSIVRVDVTDTGGVTGANTFTVRWHYPKEKATLSATGAPFWQSAELKTDPAPSLGYVNGTAIGTFGYSSYKDFFPVASSAIFGVAANGTPSPGSFTTPAWSAFVAAVGVAASQVQPVTTSPGASFNDCWNEPLSEGLPTPRDPALMSKYQMLPMLEVRYREETWTYDLYDQKGYSGQGKEGFNHFLGEVKSAGSFAKIVLAPPGG